jgi:hypothetical protein
MKKGINNGIKETLFVLNHSQLMDAISKSKRELEKGCFVAQQNEESISQFLDRISVDLVESRAGKIDRK